MKGDWKKKIMDKSESIGIKKIIFTAILIVFILYKFLCSSNIGIFDRREKIETAPNVAVETKADRKGEFAVNKKDEKPQKITVYITGAVANPGVFHLSSEERLDDAIKKAGGPTDKADLNRVNLAMKIEDSQHYIIPTKGEDISNGATDVNATNTSDNKNSSKSSSGKININTADEKELESIPGVGPATSKKIIDYRDKEGKFSDIADIKNVSGIGDKKFENIKEYIDVK